MFFLTGFKLFWGVNPKECEHFSYSKLYSVGTLHLCLKMPVLIQKESAQSEYTELSKVPKCCALAFFWIISIICHIMEAFLALRGRIDLIPSVLFQYHIILRPPPPPIKS